MQKHSISEWRACLIIGIARSTKRHQVIRNKENEPISERLVILASKWKRFGYRRLQVMLEHKKVYRLYNEAGLSLERKKRNKVYLKLETVSYRLKTLFAFPPIIFRFWFLDPIFGFGSNPSFPKIRLRYPLRIYPTGS